jgi:N6-L-threonylcarbamoyladenine synthase
MENILPVVHRALAHAGITLQEIDGIAFTQAPGLIGALLVGSSFAKSLALALNKPLIAVHHMQAHVLANLIEHPHLSFPFLCLTVSGGHTQIVLAHNATRQEILGQTRDDAAGEAFDKSAKILGLPYPGGPLIDKYAAQGEPVYDFPEPQIPGLNFSFSGLKTSILYFLQEHTKTDPAFAQINMPNLCASIQHRIITILLRKLKKASAQTGITRVCLAGGVSANGGLRKSFAELGKQQGWETFIPSLEYCTDNAAMIAITGYHKLQAGETVDLNVSPSARG